MTKPLDVEHETPEQELLEGLYLELHRDETDPRFLHFGMRLLTPPGDPIPDMHVVPEPADMEEDLQRGHLALFYDRLTRSMVETMNRGAAARGDPERLTLEGTLRALETTHHHARHLSAEDLGEARPMPLPDAILTSEAHRCETPDSVRSLDERLLEVIPHMIAAPGRFLVQFDVGEIPSRERAVELTIRALGELLADDVIVKRPFGDHCARHDRVHGYQVTLLLGFEVAETDRPARVLSSIVQTVKLLEPFGAVEIWRIGKCVEPGDLLRG